MLNLLKKQIFKNNHYSGSFLDPENWWCILAQFEKFEQIWGTVKAGLLNLIKKDLKISSPYVSHFICLLTYYHMCATNFQKNASLRSCWWCKIGAKWPICPNQQQEPLLKISYIPLLSVMTLHYHRLYNLSSEDMK